MILHTKAGEKVRGKFLNKNRNSVVVETSDGPRAIGVEQLRSVERQRIDRSGTDERGRPVHPKDAADLRWPRKGC